MRRVLVVDDEKFAVEGLIRYVDWVSLGVTRVLGAYSLREAEAVLLKEDFDVLLCDIEMPQGSGLDLVAWVSENRRGVDTVFLTCHADFGYAQTALRLGGFDYILKPVPYKKLEETLASLFAKRDREAALRDEALAGELWLRNRSALANAFWLGLASGSVSGSSSELFAAASESGVAIVRDSLLSPILFSVRGWTRALSARDSQLLETALRKCVEESCARSGEEARVLRLGEGKALGILAGEVSSPARIRVFESVVAYCREHFYCELSCYIGRAVGLEGFRGAVDELRGLDANRFACRGEVAAADSLEDSGSCEPRTPDVMLWAMMLASGNSEDVRREARAYIETMSRGGLWRGGALQSFKQDFSQAVYSILKSKRVPAHELFDDPRSLELERKAAESLSDLAAWVDHLLDGVGAKLDELEKSGSPLERAMRYIDRHIGGDLSCSLIAHEVSLNADYLSRIFKRERGMSVSEYIIGERMRVAADLVDKTDLPIGEIASRVGYTNFSHFSEIFKKTEGQSPSAYRTRNRPAPKTAEP